MTFHTWAAQHPDKRVLVQAADGQAWCASELDQRAHQAAAWLIGLGLQPGDTIALLLENRSETIELALAARLAGLYYTAISTHLAPPELAHILNDSQARLLFVSASTAGLLAGCAPVAGLRQLAVDPGVAGAEPYRPLVMAQPMGQPLPERPVGRDLLYSSGTTGRPKGVRRPMAPASARNMVDAEVAAWRRQFGFDTHTVYLSTAPMYHAAPLRYILRTLDVGGSAVIAARFDPEAALALIARYRVTHSQWVPTMFSRLLKLPAEVRARHDLSTLRMAVHSAAPCPVPLKLAMMDWWGDILHEYYAGSEGIGATAITPQEWRRHPGSVGRAMAGQVHIVGDDGEELPTGEVGRIYFSGIASFAYLNDPQKTREAYNDRGWATYGDLGHLDAEGYLYLSDRRADLILSGGVNVYPQEIENRLLLHPAVADAAVVGVPDADLGEVPKAVVSLRDPAQAGAAMAQALFDFCASGLSRLKLPRRIVFEQDLPRLDTGKLLRRVLKEHHRQTPDSGHQPQRAPAADAAATDVARRTNTTA